MNNKQKNRGFILRLSEKLFGIEKISKTLIKWFYLTKIIQASFLLSSIKVPYLNFNFIDLKIHVNQALSKI